MTILVILLTSDMTFVHVQRAQRTVEETCTRLAIGGHPCAEFKVKVKESEETPPRYVDAYLTVQSGVCIINLTPLALRDPQVVTHEACHCAYDRQDVGTRGWLLTNKQEIKDRELRAKKCAKERMKQ